MAKSKNKKTDDQNKNTKAVSLSVNDNLYTEVATLSTAGFTSFLECLPNPDPVLRKKGLNIKVYREMTADAHIGGCIDSRKSGTKRLLNNIKCQNERSKIYAALSSWIKDIDLYALIDDILNAPLYGYQPIEIMWERTGSLILPSALVAKPQEWFCFDTNNNFRLKGSGKSVIVPPNKFLLPRNKPSYTNPYGEPVLSRAFWEHVFIKSGRKFWLYFVEKYAMPHIWATHSRSASDDEINKLLRVLGDMVQDAVAAIPEGTQIEYKESSSKGDSNAIYDTFVNRCERNISKAILGQTLTTDVGDTGSYAASKTHSDVRQDIIDSDKMLVENTVNKLFKLINEINFNDTDCPTFELYAQEDVDKSLAERDKMLSDTGVRFTKGYFIRTYGFKDDEIEIKEPQTDVQPFASSKNGTIVNTGNHTSDYQAALDDAACQITDDELEGLCKDIVLPVIDFYKKGDIAGALENLSSVYPMMSSQELEDKLTKVIFAAEMLGRLEVQSEQS